MIDNSLTYYPTLDKYHSGDRESPVYNEGAITLITGRTIGYRFFFLNLLVQQLLNNPKSVCLLIEMKKPEKFHTHLSDIHLNFGMDIDLKKQIISFVEYKLYANDFYTVDSVAIKQQASNLFDEWKETNRLLNDYACFTGDGVENIAQNIEDQKRRYGVTHVFIDNINGIKNDKSQILHTFAAETISDKLCMVAKKSNVFIIACAGIDVNESDRRQSRGAEAKYLEKMMEITPYTLYTKVVIIVDVFWSLNVTDELAMTLSYYRQNDKSLPVLEGLPNVGYYRGFRRKGLVNDFLIGMLGTGIPC